MFKTKSAITALSLGALGIVFGDIGTSPLYALQVVFGLTGRRMAVSETNVYGVISLIIWSITLVVSIKFLMFIMRADNKGEGGIMALVGLIKGIKRNTKFQLFFILLGLIGVSLFYGDCVITPAISVLSAIEGLSVISPGLQFLVLPLTLVILAILFRIQRYGTAWIGHLFGPVMFVWFLVIGIGGAWQILLHPGVLQSLSPLTALMFLYSWPLIGLLAMTAVVLAITGAEALFADMGHFGRKPIARVWFMVVFPSLVLCYMGEGALLLQNPNFGSSTLFELFPPSLRLPVILLATLATLIASQSVISGAFSLTQQAIQLGFLPKMRITHTSVKEIGQIYAPFVNFCLFILVTILVLFFGSSEKLANAYGIAVSGTLATDSILFLVVAARLWGKHLIYLLFAGLLFLPLDSLFIASNLPKILQGAWVPLLIGATMFVIIRTWSTGESIISAERRALEGRLSDFIPWLHSLNPPVRRVPGLAVYIGHHPEFAPLALKASVEDLHELPNNAIIVSVITTAAAHVHPNDRAVYEKLSADDGISHLRLSFGFHDHINIPLALKEARSLSPQLAVNPGEISYLVSLSRVVSTKRHNLAMWRKSLYGLMSRNELNPSDYYKLPINRTEELRTLIKL